MLWEVLDSAIPFLAFPVVGGLGYWRYHKHLFGMLKEEEKLSYCEEKIPFDDSTQKVINELTEYITLRWNPTHVAGIRWIWSNKKDPVVRGSTSTRSGTLIGIPHSFSYQNTADLDMSQVISDYSNFSNMDSVNQGKFLNSLILSDNAKRFALARELHFIHSKYVHVDGLIPLAMGGVGVMSAVLMNRSRYFGFTRTKRPFRILVYVAIAFSVVNLSQQLLKFYFKDLHLKSDREAANMGKDYVMGGIEYTGKVIKRNQLLRELSGKSGGETYTPLGDEIPGYFSTDAPISLRLRYMIGQARTLYEKDEKLNILIDKTVKDIEVKQ